MKRYPFIEKLVAEDFIAMMDLFIDKVKEEDKIRWLSDIRETYFEK